MCLRISSYSFRQSIDAIVGKNLRTLKQLIENLTDLDHQDYRQYDSVIQRIDAVHRDTASELNGIRFLLLEHKHYLERLKIAKEEIQTEQQLHHFKVIVLQRSGQLK